MKKKISSQPGMFDTVYAPKNIDKIELSDPGKKAVPPVEKVVATEPVKPYSDALKALSEIERKRLFPNSPPPTLREMKANKNKK